MSEREAHLARFLAGAGWDGAQRRPLPADASFRRYVRLSREGATAILMDAPPPREDVRPFVAVARILRDLGLSAPEIIAQDAEAGFLLIEDLGDGTYTRLLDGGAGEEALYALAVDALVHLHRRYAGGAALPRYDAPRFLAEAALLPDWYLPAISGRAPAAAVRASFLDAWEAVLPAASLAGETLVLRDYHVDNLMLLPGREGTAACGLLDFQDAVIGPASYDLVSLLEDARRDVPPALAARMTDRYLDAFPDLDRDAFTRSCAVLGVQRGLKVIGIFTRLARRDGKPAYLRHIPRVWRLVEARLRHPALAPVAAWMEREMPPELRRMPAAGEAA